MVGCPNSGNIFYYFCKLKNNLIFQNKTKVWRVKEKLSVITLVVNKKLKRKIYA